MRVTTSQYKISGKNSHLLSQNVFLQSIIYPSEKTIHWNKQHFGMRWKSCVAYRPPQFSFLHGVSTIKITDQSSIVCCCCCFFNILFALFLFLFISHYLKKKTVHEPVHDRRSMDPVQSGGPCFVLTPTILVLVQAESLRRIWAEGRHSFKVFLSIEMKC